MKRHHWILLAMVAIAALVLLFATRSASGADPDRGRALYEQRCGGCHSESVHGRAKRVAADFAAVRGWVSRWSRSLELGWGAEELDDVAVHLNNTYYRYPCPSPACKVLSLSSSQHPGRRAPDPGHSPR